MKLSVRTKLVRHKAILQARSAPKQSTEKRLHKLAQHRRTTLPTYA